MQLPHRTASEVAAPLPPGKRRGTSSTSCTASLFKSYTLVNRLLSLIETGELSGVRTDTLKRLLNRLLTSANIPFHGEPAIGMQVMGVLETRNLDFRNLIMLSLNEGQLPKAGGESSFIPYNLRKAFGMTTIEHKNAVMPTTSTASSNGQKTSPYYITPLRTD